MWFGAITADAAKASCSHYKYSIITATDKQHTFCAQYGNQASEYL